MAAKSDLDKLSSALQKLDQLSNDKLYRPHLGEDSLEVNLGQRVAQLRQSLEFHLAHAPIIHDAPVREVASRFETIVNLLISQATLSETEYVKRSPALINEFGIQTRNIGVERTHFVCAALQNAGLLSKANLAMDFATLSKEARGVQEGAIATIRMEALAQIDEIKDQQRVALEISVQDAKAQFGDAQKNLGQEAKKWGWSATLAFLVLLSAMILFMRNPSFLSPSSSMDLSDKVVSGIVRVSFLAMLAGIATYCLRAYSAFNHMSQRNHHRQKVVNSIETFVKAAYSADAKDKILLHLIGSVARFGKSGLLRKEEEIVGGSTLNIGELGGLARKVADPS